MITWLKVGLRNLIKNRRRSIFTLLSIAVGFAALNLFGGFAEYMNETIRLVTIYAGAQGHLTIFKQGFLEKGQLDPPRYLLMPDELRTIRDVCDQHPEVELITPQLAITGLLTNGKQSTVFVAQGIVPSDRKIFFERFRAILLAKVKTGVVGIEGKMLADEQEQGVALSRGLAALLKLKLGDWAVAFTGTVDGQMNAMDVEVFQLFNVRSQQLNDKFMIVPFSFAQKLYDTGGADRVAVLLKRTDKTGRVRDQLHQALEARGLDLELKSWNEMSAWYRKVKNMFDTIFQFMFIIVIAIVMMSVINTMGMAVLERTREIGTLRALGLKRRGILSLFAIESCMLGILGNCLGGALTIVGWGLVKILEPTWVPPGVPRPVIIRIDLVPEKMVLSFLFLVAIFLLASLIPARRAARHNIVDALGHI
jgi:putative ABC transport system permease protein